MITRCQLDSSSQTLWIFHLIKLSHCFISEKHSTWLSDPIFISKVKMGHKTLYKKQQCWKFIVFIGPWFIFLMVMDTVYPKKCAHAFVVLCFVVVMQSFIMNSHEVFIHIHQGCFAGTGAIVRLPQCQWSKPDGYGKISQCITTAKHNKAKTVCIFLGIYCKSSLMVIVHNKL